MNLPKYFGNEFVDGVLETSDFASPEPIVDFATARPVSIETDPPPGHAGIAAP